jgi:hypothetical protein
MPEPAVFPDLPYDFAGTLTGTIDAPDEQIPIKVDLEILFRRTGAHIQIKTLGEETLLVELSGQEAWQLLAALMAAVTN